MKNTELFSSISGHPQDAWMAIWLRAWAEHEIQDTINGWNNTKAPFIWSWVPETTLPISYPHRLTFHCVIEKASNHLYVPELSHLSR